MAKTLFLTYGDINSASSRYRSFWPSKYIEDCKVYPIVNALQSGVPIDGDTQTIVFQKSAHKTIMKYCSDAGLKIIWDVCDPTWWWMPDEVDKILQYVDIVTGSTEAILEDISDQYASSHILNCKYIPDSFETSHYSGAKHNDLNKDNIRLIWYGHSNNRIMLLPHLTELERFSAVNGVGVTLTVMDGQPTDKWLSKYINIEHVNWSLDTEVETISAHDMAFLPSYPGIWGKVKSDNKAVHAGYCGLLTYDPAKPKAAFEKMLSWGADELDGGWLKEHDASVVAETWKEVMA